MSENIRIHKIFKIIIYVFKYYKLFNYYNDNNAIM